MAKQPERCEKRTAAAVAVMLTTPDSELPTELALTENISRNGARVVTRGLWCVKDSLVIKSLEGGLQSQAQVIYRQLVRRDVHAIGLELIGARGNWQRE